MYNPWSVINYVDSCYKNKKEFPRPYWSNTSSNSIVIFSTGVLILPLSPPHIQERIRIPLLVQLCPLINRNPICS